MKNDGGPAFPLMIGGNDLTHYKGMSIRDYFAGDAMKGIMGSFSNLDCADGFMIHANRLGLSIKALIAQEAYSQADAMLAEREK